MALSEQEQRLLDEMERHLYQNEADVVSTTPRSSAPVSTRSIVLSILAVAIGLGIVLVALSLQLPIAVGVIIGIGGFLVMLLGVLFAFRSKRPGPGEKAADVGGSSGAPSAKGTAKSSPSGGGFMDRLEDRWDRRRNGD